MGGFTLLKGDGQQRHHSDGCERREGGGGVVASVSFAGAGEGVVLFQDGLVAFVLVLFSGARADDAGLPPDVLVRLPAEGLLRGAGFEELVLQLLSHLGLFSVINRFLYERIHALLIYSGVALVALEAVCEERRRQEQADDDGNLGDHFCFAEIMRVSEP